MIVMGGRTGHVEAYNVRIQCMHVCMFEPVRRMHLDPFITFVFEISPLIHQPYLCVCNMYGGGGVYDRYMHVEHFTLNDTMVTSCSHNNSLSLSPSPPPPPPPSSSFVAIL